jgi:hypothetical protein
MCGITIESRKGDNKLHFFPQAQFLLRVLGIREFIEFEWKFCLYMDVQKRFLLGFN